MKKRHLLLGAALSVACIVVTATWLKSRDTARTSALEMLSRLDQDCLGCGPGPEPDYKANFPHPQAFALIASASALLGEKEPCRSAADWLVRHSAPGWGLGFAWDAFSDGSVNPANTVYGVTVAMAARGLLDAHQSCYRPEYLPSAIAALDYYSKFFTETSDGGFFWYSDQKADAQNVLNISAVLLPTLALAGRIAHRPDFTELAQKAASDLLNHQISVGGLDYWKYMDTSPIPNDAVHAGMMVAALAEYKEITGTQFDIGPACNYLPTFISDGRTLDFSPVGDLPESLRARPARLWGVGALAHALTKCGLHDHAAMVVQDMQRYRFEADRYSSIPDGEKLQDVRMISFVLLGLSKMSQASLWSRMTSTFR